MYEPDSGLLLCCSLHCSYHCLIAAAGELLSLIPAAHRKGAQRSRVPLGDVDLLSEDPGILSCEGMEPAEGIYQKQTPCCIVAN